jgi:hypothetical protein
VQAREGQRRTEGRANDPGISEVIMFVLVLYLPLPSDAPDRTHRKYALEIGSASASVSVSWKEGRVTRILKKLC